MYCPFGGRGLRATYLGGSAMNVYTLTRRQRRFQKSTGFKRGRTAWHGRAKTDTSLPRVAISTAPAPRGSGRVGSTWSGQRAQAPVVTAAYAEVATWKCGELKLYFYQSAGGLIYIYIPGTCTTEVVGYPV